MEGEGSVEFIKVTEQFAIGKQMTTGQMEQVKEKGFKSVLNLREKNEKGFVAEEEDVFTNRLGLAYRNVGVDSLDDLDRSLATEMIKAMHELSTPVLVHCKIGLTAAFIVLVDVAIRYGKQPADFYDWAAQMNFLAIINSPHLYKLAHDLITNPPDFYSA